MNKHSPTSLFNQRSHSSLSFPCKDLMLFKYSKTTSTKYLYLMVGKQYGSAVQRNQLKRWIRVLYKDLLKQQGALGLMVRPLKKGLSFHEARFCFDTLKTRLLGS